jgi:hypothetical protein
MTQTQQRPNVKETIKRLGHCIELISMDPHFHEISVGLFLKGTTLTVWSYSQVPGTPARLRQIRDRVVALGDLKPVKGSDVEAVIEPDGIWMKPLRFLFKEAVEREPSELPSGPIEAADNKSTLTFNVTGEQTRDGYTYTVTAAGEAERALPRVKAVVGGFMRYGECQRVREDQFRFQDGKRHDGFARLLLPYARNVSAVESMLAAEELEGQMTTQTLGFSQT